MVGGVEMMVVGANVMAEGMTLGREGEVEAEPMPGEFPCPLLVVTDNGAAWGSVTGGGGGVGVAMVSDARRDERLDYN